MVDKVASRLLGIDPGTLRMGYGLLETTPNGDVKVVTWGVLTASSRASLGERLHHLYSELTLIMERYSPEHIAVEEPFVALNVKSAMAVGQSQGLALLAAAARGIEAARYTPTQAKYAVAGHGRASKEQVQQAVVMHLGLSSVPEPEDAADALAVALCHWQTMRGAALANS